MPFHCFSMRLAIRASNIGRTAHPVCSPPNICRLSGLIDGFQQILEGLAIDDDETFARVTDQPGLPQPVEQTGDHLAACADQPAQLLLGDAMTDPDSQWCGLTQIGRELQQRTREPSHRRFYRKAFESLIALQEES